MDQCSDFDRTHGSLLLFNELKNTVNIISSKKGGYTETEAITLDVIVGGSLSPTTFENTTYNAFREDWGVQFNYNTLQKRLERKKSFLEGNLGGLVDMTKWDGSGNKWDSEAIDLFRSFYKFPSPAIYVDHTGRKVKFTDFNGEEQYELLFGINPKSTYISSLAQKRTIMFLFLSAERFEDSV